VATTVAALVMPVVLLLILLAVQVAVGFHARQVVATAAQDGLRAAQDRGGDVDDADAVARRLLTSEADAFLDDIIVTPTRTGAEVTVAVSGSVISVVPWLSWRVTATETGPVEQFRPGGEP
jgi:hypothetical protein